MVFRSIDVGHHRLDGRVRVLHQVPPVASDRFEAVDRLPDFKQMFISFRQMNLQIFRFYSGSVGDIRQAGDGFPSPRYPAFMFVSPKRR